MNNEHDSNHASNTKYTRLMRPLVSKLMKLERKLLGHADFTMFDCEKFLANKHLNSREIDCNVLITACKKRCASPIIGRGLWVGKYHRHATPRHHLAGNLLVKSANTRLQDLSPFIDKELYKDYSDIFLIFRNIVFTLMNHQEGSGFGLLKSLAARTYGGGMALVTKSSYYSLNQKALFENNAQSSGGIGHNFYEDLTDWLAATDNDLSITRRYKNEMVIGYLARLLSMNAQSLLPPLIPVILHWLREEYDRSQNMQFLSIQRSLISDFWITQKSLHSCGGTRKAIELFWTFYTSGYYRELFVQLSPKSPIHTVDNYFNTIMRELFSRSNCIEFSIMKQVSLLGGHEQYHLLDMVYQTILEDPTSPTNNRLLAVILSQIMESASSTSDSIYSIDDSLGLFVKFLQVWLSFLCEHTMTYNSLYPGNDNMFKGCVALGKYLCKRARKISRTCKAESVDKWALKNIYNRIESLVGAIQLFEAYFLDLPYLSTSLCKSYEELADAILLVQCAALKLKDHREMDNFVYWLESREWPQVRFIVERLVHLLHG